MRIEFKVIPHEQQRYPTVGDYWLDENGVWQFRVSDMGNPIYEKAVLLHEFIEWSLTQQRGISEESISEFDIEFEKNRQDGDISECGDSPDAPYRLEHRFAENIERQFIHESGIVWADYDNTVCNL